MTYHLATFGCQMNLSDSERMVAILTKMNLKPAAPAQADILIFNLCSVRQAAVDRVWGNFKGRMAKGKRQNKKPLIILTGCILPADKKKLAPKVDLILDIKDLNSWSGIIIKTLKHKNTKTQKQYNNETMKQCGNGTKIAHRADYFAVPPQYSSHFSAFVPIMTGCNNFCAYCAVPYTRGREYSRPAEEITTEVGNLIQNGYKEIILLGQNVNSYQSKIFNPAAAGQISNSKFQISKNTSVNFPTLLKLINKIPGNYWLSFITSHPKDMSDELMKCLTECQHLIPYVHLPLQSGSDKILKAMNRKYTAKDYTKLVRKIRMIFALNSHHYSHVTPRLAISTDIIVGFPGETKKDFLATADLMKKIKFDMAYLAEYSPRPGTAAARLKDKISHKEKTRRRQILNEILKTTALENNQKLVGKTTETLVESTKDGLAFGQTKMMKNVKIKLESKKQNLIGKFVDVKIIKAGPWGLEGKLT